MLVMKPGSLSTKFMSIFILLLKKQLSTLILRHKTMKRKGGGELKILVKVNLFMIETWHTSGKEDGIIGLLE